MDRRVVVAGVETRDDRTQCLGAREPMRDEGGCDAAPAEARMDPERVQPGLAVAAERELRDADRSIADAREPEAAATIAHPFVEDVGEVITSAPDMAADVAHSALIARRRAADRDLVLRAHVP